MAEEIKKKKAWKIVLVATVVYFVLYVAMSLLGSWLSKFGEAGEMVGFTANLPIMMLNMIVLIYILNALLYKPVLKFMEDRNNRIRRQISEAEDDRRKSKENLAETQQELSKIRTESSSMLRQARQEAQQERQKLMAAAEQERNALIEKAQNEIDLQVGKAQAELRGEVANMAVLISQQVVKSAMSADDLQKLAEESLAQMEQQAAN